MGTPKRAILVHEDKANLEYAQLDDGKLESKISTINLTIAAT